MKKSNLIVVSAALAAAVISMPAAAQSKGFQPGFYLGAGVGQGYVNNSNAVGTYQGVAFTTAGFNNHETAWQVSGGYQFTENWGVELQYTDLGSRNGTITALGATAPTNDAKATQWGGALTGTLPLDSNFFLRGKIGVSSNHLDDVNAIVGGRTIVVGGASHTDVLAGAGIGYKFNENLSARLEYEYFGKFETNNSSGNGTGSNWGVRLQYKF
jgi:OOP family OmpA-OmpF porin